MNEMVDYLEKFLPFDIGQVIFDNKIIEFVEFSMTREWQKEPIIQRFEYTTQGLTEIVEFYERLENDEEILSTQGEGKNQNKKTKQSGECHQPTKLAQSKGSHHAAKTLEEDVNKKWN